MGMYEGVYIEKRVFSVSNLVCAIWSVSDKEQQ